MEVVTLTLQKLSFLRDNQRPVPLFLSEAMFPARWSCSVSVFPHGQGVRYIGVLRHRAAAQDVLWKSRVLAAEAKKADGASETTLRIPRPPSLIGRLAWVQLHADSALLVILHKADLRSESKVDCWVVPAWCGPQRVQNFGSAEKRAQDDEGVVC